MLKLTVNLNLLNKLNGCKHILMLVKYLLLLIDSISHIPLLFKSDL